MAVLSILLKPAVVVGDVVASREAEDRAALHASVQGALAATNNVVRPVHPLTPTVGDEFQGTYRHLREALHATLLIRTALPAEYDVRFGIGLGDVVPLAGSHRGFPQQDGPGWWAARDAIDWVAEAQKRRGIPKSIRTYVRSGQKLEPGQGLEALTAYLVARDEIVTSMNGRDRRVLHAMLLGTSLADIAVDEGVTLSAISQRAHKSGAAALVFAEETLA